MTSLAEIVLGAIARRDGPPPNEPADPVGSALEALIARIRAAKAARVDRRAKPPAMAPTRPVPFVSTKRRRAGKELQR